MSCVMMAVRWLLLWLLLGLVVTWLFGAIVDGYNLSEDHYDD